MKNASILGLIGLMLCNVLTAQTVTFSDDLNTLEKHFKPIVLKEGSQRVSVLGELQGRVMVASLSGDNGESIGWINRPKLEEGKYTNNTPLGGADRLWFGPEAGPYSLFFEANNEQTGENVVVPSAISIQAFATQALTTNEAIFSENIELTNYSNFTFQVKVDRAIRVLPKKKIEQSLNATFGNKIHFVSYQTETRITNIGKQAWSKETGLLSIWDLGAFEPSKYNTAVIPVKGERPQANAYINPLKPSYTQVSNSHVFYRADANYLDKIGVAPEHTLPIMGAWDPQRERLTLVQFAFNDDDGVFVSSVWGDKHQPYQGDVTNVFNDGKMGDAGPFGPFYELESSSHALELKPGQKQNHVHTTMHFEGDRAQLNQLALDTLGIALNDIERVFADRTNPSNK